MWDMRFARPFGGIPGRNILLVVAALVVAFFTSIVALAPTAHAADATWRGQAIVYGNHQYVQDGVIKKGDSRNLPTGTQVFVYSVKPQNGGTQKADVIYFAKGVDPTSATSAKYVEYNFVPPDHYSHPSATKTISIDPQTGVAESGVTSCDSTYTLGLGWIICPATNMLSSAMDWLFGVLSNFLVVRPAQTNQENALYRAWAIMRNFANVAFVIGFIVIIYSQLTSLGVSNYGIKKLLPRLIVAAILVNVSYWVCAVAIDLSNLVGYSIQDLFIFLRNHIVGNEGNGWSIVSWRSVSGFILSGGTAAAAGVVGAGVILSGTVGAAIYLLLPILVSVLVSVLIALLVMAARQAIITVLVIVAPLAFVAYLLPNTEKYFDKWRDLFTTMLIMFPIFSMVFGGAQLAGVAIIQNADSINLIILGMAVQVAPVAITPLLLRVSGSLLGKVAGIINNPSKGLVDRTRNWSKERADQHRDRVLANPNARGLNRISQNMNMRKRQRESWQKVNQARANNLFEGSEAYHAIETAQREADRLKKIIDAQHTIDWEIRARLDRESQEQELRLRTVTDSVKLEEARNDSIYEEFKAGRQPFTGPMSLPMVALMNQAGYTDEQLALEGMRKASAENVSRSAHVSHLTQNEMLRRYAGGIDPYGAIKAEANARSEESSKYMENVQAAGKLLVNEGYNAQELMDIVQKHQMRGGGTAGSIEAHAAVQNILNGSGSATAAMHLTDYIAKNYHVNAGDTQDVQKEKRDMQQIFDAALSTSKVAPTYIGNIDRSNMKLAEFKTVGEDSIVNNYNAQKVKAETYTKMSVDELKRTVQVLRTRVNDIDATSKDLAAQQIDNALSNPMLNGQIGDREKQLMRVVQTYMRGHPDESLITTRSATVPRT